MNWKPLFLLVTTSVVIIPFDLQHKALADEATIGPSIEYGYFTYVKPSVSIHSYARSKEDKTLFTVAITNQNQVVDGNGLVVPSALLVDCKDGSGRINFMEKLSESPKEQALESLKLEITKFCQLHKKLWKHSDW